MTRGVAATLSLSFAGALFAAADGIAVTAQVPGPVEARTAQRSGEYRDAIAIYRQVLQRDPSIAQARIGLVESLRTRSR
jgi:hypothetical protein